MSANSVTDWIVKPVYAGVTTRIAGFTVYRVHNPYTDKARIESLKPHLFSTEAAALAAKEKA